MLPLKEFLGLAKTDPGAIIPAEAQKAQADLQGFATQVHVTDQPHAAGWPFLGKTSTRILAPDQLRGSDPWPYTEGGIDRPNRYVYVVQAGDTPSSVAKALYGANTRENRKKVIMHGLVEGATIAAT